MHCTAGTLSKYSRSTASRRAANIIRGGVDWAGLRIMGKAGRLREFSLVLRFLTEAVLECFCFYNFEPS